MNRQFGLVLLLFLSVGLLNASTPQPLKIVHHDIDENLIDSPEEMYSNDVPKSVIKTSTPKVKVAETDSSTTSPATTSPSATAATNKPTAKPISADILNDLIEASKHNSALADDPRFLQMVPVKSASDNTKKTTEKESTENYDDDDNYDEEYNYDDDYDSYDETSTTTKSPKEKLKPKSESKTALPELQKLKPIDKTGKDKDVKKDIDNNEIDYSEDDDDNDDDDDDDDNDDEDNEDDITDDEEIEFNENVPCPRYCSCARNINSFLVATCSRLDPGTQKFGLDITDLIVTDVGPKYPILLTPEFFLKLGLKQVSSIKIANSTMEFLHPGAFHGLEELYSVNLTNVGLSIISPDTFSKNKKLRMLTISGNDLSIMSTVNYLLNSSSIEELDLSRNNLMELNPNAFSQLSNIVYINLSQNNLKQIPEKVFDTVATIEELDLSYNSLTSLPANIFNRTALAILHLKYNAFTGDFSFGTDDIQQLDVSFNSINQLHHGMFDKMVGLTNLNLKGNGITKIQSDSFITLKSLRHIDLSINEFDQLSSMMFYKNSELDVIRLNDNPKLSQLPTDGFLNFNGYFTVYYLDISNCAIGALGHKTFSTMPHLATLKLAWNNINNLDRDTFNSLTKLTDLDLSNNLIVKLDELIFMNNNDLIKLNLAGNPIGKLPVRLFMPMSKLRELDVSDCELDSLLSDNNYSVMRKYKFFETLRSFNASLNQIKRISAHDIKYFKNLRTLDISNNPIRCNFDFQDFISYVSLNTKTSPRKMPTLANLENDAAIAEMQSSVGWSELAHEVCKHEEPVDNSKDNKLEERLKNADKKLEDDDKNLNKILKDSRKSEDKHEHQAKHLNEDVNEDVENNGGETNDDDDTDDDDENASEYDDDDDDDDDDNDNDDGFDTFDKKKATTVDLLPILKDHGIKVDGVELSKETKDDFLLNKFMNNADEKSEEESAEEQLIIERGHLYGYSTEFLIPILMLATFVLAVLLIIAKILSIVMRKRGERYRMAILAASKNSIVYQKLTEDIKPTEKEHKQPKVHRYAPINQV